MADINYQTLNYSISGIAYSTFLTGICGANIVGMYVTSSGADSGLIYDESAAQWIGLNFPGAASTVPYGPTAGNATNGIVVVGSYTLPGENADNGFLYDASQPAGSQWTTLDAPGATDTIPHSTSGGFVVGNYDDLTSSNPDFQIYPSGGNAFIYDIATKTFTTNDMPGAISTTAYGIWDGVIAGGFTELSGDAQVTQGYIYDTASGSWHVYAHPGAEITHFDGITAGSTPGSYLLTGDYVALGDPAGSPEHGFYVTVKDWVATGWTDLSVPGSTNTSGNSGFGDMAVGVYTTSSSDLINGYVATIPCFAAGTMIGTQDGAVPVEALTPGTVLTTHFGSTQQVQWIGHRRVNCRSHPNPRAVWPVRIERDAFGPGSPSRELHLSPDHAIFIDNVLIPVKLLIDGSTIAQLPVDEIVYYHVELGHHDVVLAEGLPCESYLETGQRTAFGNGGDATMLHPDFARPDFARPDFARNPETQLVWEGLSCAPLIVTGPVLGRVREELGRRAARLPLKRAVV